MATTIKGSSLNWGYCYFTYTTSSDKTTYTITASMGVHRNASAVAASGSLSFLLEGTTKAKYTGNYPKGTGDYTVISSKSYKYKKTHSSQTGSVVASATGKDYYESGAVLAFTIPAKPSYTVVYNANSGSGAPANQTKWYDETLQISPTKPTKSGYIFRGWATSQADANVGTVAYAAGANYTGNEALTLYAVWELAYTSPTINQLIIERCKSDGTDYDEGTYAKVSFDWSVYINDASRYYGGTVCPYTNSVADITIKVGEITKTISSTTSMSVNEIIDTSVTDPFNVDVEYPVSITVADTRADVSNNTKTVTSRLLPPIFILDANADATAVGILKSAPDDGQGVYLGGDLHAEGNTGYFEDVYLKNQTAHVGQVFNWQGNLKSNLTANVDAYVEAAGSITLPAGHTYLVIGYLAMANSTNGATNRRIQFFNKTDATALVTESRLVAAQNWGTLQVLQIFEISADMTVTVRGAANRPTTTIPTAWIRAVCIA